MRERCDAAEACWLTHSPEVSKALTELDRKAAEMLVTEDEFGMSAADEAAQDAMMERFPSALPEDMLDP